MKKPEWYESTACYAKAETRMAIRQLTTTLICYSLLLVLMTLTVRYSHSYWITHALAVIAAALYARIFIFSTIAHTVHSYRHPAGTKS